MELAPSRPSAVSLIAGSRAPARGDRECSFAPEAQTSRWAVAWLLSARTGHLAGVEDSAASESWCLLAAGVAANATCAIGPAGALAPGDMQVTRSRKRESCAA
jgi:hypothetical protein